MWNSHETIYSVPSLRARTVCVCARGRIIIRSQTFSGIHVYLCLCDTVKFTHSPTCLLRANFFHICTSELREKSKKKWRGFGNGNASRTRWSWTMYNVLLYSSSATTFSVYRIQYTLYALMSHLQSKHMKWKFVENHAANGKRWQFSEMYHILI